MAKIINREIINKNIIIEDRKGFDLEGVLYNYNDLSKRIDRAKNFLKDNNAKKGNRILIGTLPTIELIALFFASSELGLTVFIADNSNYSNLPVIDFFVVMKENLIYKHGHSQKFFCNYSKTVLYLDDLCMYDNFTKNTDTDSNTESIVIESLSRKTNNFVRHTHEFIFDITKRNRILFDGSVGYWLNLNHGSSLATYFLPALCSEKVQSFVNFFLDLTSKPVNMDNSNVDHVNIAYESVLENIPNCFLKKNPNLTIHTLMPLNKKLIKFYKKGYCRDIISIFGSNETSGPVFVNKASYKHSNTNVYKILDNFYELDFSNTLKIKMYNEWIETFDVFDIIDKDTVIFIGNKKLK